MMRQTLTGKELFGLVPRVSFGDLIGQSAASTPTDTLNAITTSARQLLQSHLTWRV